jgi:hypothetical protein
VTCGENAKRNTPTFGEHATSKSLTFGEIAGSRTLAFYENAKAIQSHLLNTLKATRWYVVPFREHANK